MNIDNASNWDPQALGLVPMVVEQSGRGERVRHLFAPVERAGDLSCRPGVDDATPTWSLPSCCS